MGKNNIENASNPIIKLGLMEKYRTVHWESSQPRDRTRVSRIAGRRFNLWATKRIELKSSWRGDFIHKPGNLSSLFPEEVEISNELITRKPQKKSTCFQYAKVKLQQVIDL